VGANVTVPHKSDILPYLDELTPVAQAIGAANTLVVRPDGTILGDNTDAYGFAADLRARGIPVRRRALVIGAGGAARAVVYALVQAGTAVSVADRTLSRAIELCETVGQALPRDFAATDNPTGHRFPDDLPRLARDADLIVNATTLGLHGEDDSLPWDPAIRFRPDQVVYDLIYAPVVRPPRSPRPRRSVLTPFLALAARDGAQGIDGSGMLVHQGARAFELWTGLAAPVAVMAEALTVGE
jgi:shikimate dehydrogenase